MSNHEAEVRRLRMALGETQGENEQLHRKLRALKEEHGRDSSHLEGLRGAVDEMTREMDRFLDDECGTIYDLRTVLSLLKAAR